MLQSDPVTYGGDVITGRFYFAPSGSEGSPDPHGHWISLCREGIGLMASGSGAAFPAQEPADLACVVGLAA
jgi:hypothetical protein